MAIGSRVKKARKPNYALWTDFQLTTEIRINQDLIDNYDDRLRGASNELDRQRFEKIMKQLSRVNRQINKELGRRSGIR